MRVKGKSFDGSWNAVMESFTPAYIPLAKASHIAKPEVDGKGKYISSTGKGTISHMQWVRVNDTTIGSEENNREQN